MRAVRRSRSVHSPARPLDPPLQNRCVAAPRPCPAPRAHPRRPDHQVRLPRPPRAQPRHEHPAPPQPPALDPDGGRGCPPPDRACVPNVHALASVREWASRYSDIRRSARTFRDAPAAVRSRTSTGVNNLRQSHSRPAGNKKSPGGSRPPGLNGRSMACRSVRRAVGLRIDVKNGVQCRAVVHRAGPARDRADIRKRAGFRPRADADAPAAGLVSIGAKLASELVLHCRVTFHYWATSRPDRSIRTTNRFSRGPNSRHFLPESDRGCCEVSG